VLNIEFSRVSKDGRLTLVIDADNGEEVKTYFAQSISDDLGDAIADLINREGTSRDLIGFVELIGGGDSIAEFPAQVDVSENIQDWCRRGNFDAAVWATLPSQFKEQIKLDFSVDNAILYLKNLPNAAREKALEYISNALQEITTPVRRKLKNLIIRFDRHNFSLRPTSALSRLFG
jgi:hypothetical protein